MKQIVFYAPLGKGIPIEKIGGAEVGCLKTKKIYEEAGINVIPLDKPAISRGKLRYLCDMLILPFKLLHLLYKYPKSVLHIVGFYTKIARYEWILMQIGKITGHKIVYELRNGSMVRTYEEGSGSYRKVLKNLLLKPDVVLCQGMEYVDFIRKKWGVNRSYYPNYIMDDFLKENNLNRPYPLRLIYFGRVTESKNVDIIIKTLSLLRRSGLDAVLEIIGGYNGQYKMFLEQTIKDEDVAKYVTFYGRKPFAFIAERLRFAHYFVFPSQEKQEGHSNSLTEAMGCGVVPIVSTAGFNASICGIPELIMKSVNPAEYASTIIGIEKNKQWSVYSRQVYQRIKENYTQTIVSKNLISYINPLFQS